MIRMRSAIGALVACAMGLAVAFATGSAGVGSAPPEPACPPAGVPRSAGGRAAAAAGHGIAAIVGDTIVVGDDEGTRGVYRHAGSEGGVLRHAANHPSLGTVYVNDLRGPDVLTMVGPGEVTEILESGEVTHPAISSQGTLAYAVDLSFLRVRTRDGTARTHRGPAGAAALFSPVFTGPDEVVAVVQERVPGYEGHDDSLNNLYRLDLAAGTWERLTSFEADPDRWAVLRTPVALHDGSLRFVRVIGRGSATEGPRFELWRYDNGNVSRIRALPEETFLAGALGSRLVLNVPDPSGGDWRLMLESPAGSVDLGCGAVAVEPMGQLDPDLMGAQDSGAGGSGLAAEEISEDDGSEDDGSEEETDSGSYEVLSGGSMALLVGDYSSRHAAGTAAAHYGASFPGATVMGHAEAPTAVGPDAYAVVWPLPEGTSAPDELAALRARFPELEDRSWIVEL